MDKTTWVPQSLLHPVQWAQDSRAKTTLHILPLKTRRIVHPIAKFCKNKQFLAASGTKFRPCEEVILGKISKTGTPAFSFYSGVLSCIGYSCFAISVQSMVVIGQIKLRWSQTMRKTSHVLVDAKNLPDKNWKCPMLQTTSWYRCGRSICSKTMFQTKGTERMANNVPTITFLDAPHFDSKSSIEFIVFSLCGLFLSSDLAFSPHNL